MPKENLSKRDRRELAMEYCEFLMGRKATDPAYRYWTGGRDPGPTYSSCGDLPHNLVWHLGCREAWVNVAPSFRYGMNINLLCPKPIGSNPHAAATGTKFWKPGDILLMCPPSDSSKWHTCVFRSFGNGEDIITYDFGQGPTSPKMWRHGRGHIESRMVIRKESQAHVRYLISLDDIEWTEEPILPSGEFFDFMESWNG